MRRRTKNQTVSSIVEIVNVPEEKKSWSWGLGFILLWFFGCFVLFSTKSYAHVIPFSFKFPLPVGSSVFIILISMFFMSLKLKAIEGWDLSRRLSWILLSIILCAAFVLRMNNWNIPPVTYWDDWTVEILDPCYVLEYSEFPFVIDRGAREPFFTYFVAGIWTLLPKASALFIQRFACTLLEMATIWILYLVGKELGNRKTGIFAAALASVSKPLIIYCMSGMRIISLPLATAVTILITLRLMKRPKPGYFILWGTLLAFGAYTYPAFRPWILFLPGVLFLWMIVKKQINISSRLGRGAMAGYLILGYFLVKQSGYAFSSTVISGAFAWVPVVGLVISVILYYSGSKEPVEKNAWGLMFGMVLCLLLLFPLLAQDKMGNRFGRLAIGTMIQEKQGYLSEAGYVLAKAKSSLGALFVAGGQRGDFTVPNDPFLSFTEVAALGLGVVFMVRYFGMAVGMLGLGILVGISTHIFSIDPHGGKLISAVIPLILLGSTGLNALSGIFKGHKTSVLAFWILLILIGVGGMSNYSNVLRTWYDGPHTQNALVFRQVISDWDNNHIYFSRRDDFCNIGTQYVIQGNMGAKVLQNSNAVFVTPENAHKNIVALLSGQDTGNITKLKQEFPKATWTNKMAYWQGPSDVPFMLRAAISIDDLQEEPGKMFYKKSVTQGLWYRKFYPVRPVHYGSEGGLMLGEDCVDTPYAPFPDWAPPSTSVRMSGWIHSDKTQELTFSGQTNDILVMDLDGKQIITTKWLFKKDLNFKAQVKMDEGLHSVSLYSNNKRQGVPEVKVSNGVWEKRLDMLRSPN